MFYMALTSIWVEDFQNLSNKHAQSALDLLYLNNVEYLIHPDRAIHFGNKLKQLSGGRLLSKHAAQLSHASPIVFAPILTQLKPKMTRKNFITRF